MEAEPQSIRCRSWTKARRHPQVIGVIGGWVAPVVSTASQLGAAVISAILLIRTRGLWGALLPGVLDGIVIIGVPAYLWWAARYLTIEGRAPGRAVIGAMSYLSRPRAGTVDGRGYRTRRVRVDGALVFCRETC